ncbi:hypothetical protein A2U01_0084829, partial [Trifolium medium]|nr:hypothetical protein [Trifolium medium]
MPAPVTISSSYVNDEIVHGQAATINFVLQLVDNAITETMESCNNYHQLDGFVEDCSDDASIIPEEFQDDSSYVRGAPLQQVVID